MEYNEYGIPKDKDITDTPSVETKACLSNGNNPFGITLTEEEAEKFKKGLHQTMKEKEQHQ